MSAEIVTLDTTSIETRRSETADHRPAPDDGITRLAARVHGEYKEMPGLRLTVRQAARLFGVAPEVAHTVLDDLRRASILTRSGRGTYSLNR